MSNSAPENSGLVVLRCFVAHMRAASDLVLRTINAANYPQNSESSQRTHIILLPLDNKTHHANLTA